MNLNRRLIVLGGREDLRLLRRDSRVALDQLRHHATLGFNAEGQRCYVEQQHVLDVACQHAGLNPGADCDDLIGVDAAVRILTGQFFDLLLNGWHPRHAADEDDVVNVACALVLGVVECLANRSDDALDQIAGQLRELRASEARVEVLGAVGVGRDEGQVDLRLLRGRKLNLGFLGSFVEPLKRHWVGLQVDRLLLLEL